MSAKKLELQWANKDKSLYYDIKTGKYEWVDKKDPRVSEPRILLEKARYGDKDSENILIKGDNLLALKALLQDYENQIKLIYIDPPFNTGQAFEHYDDGLEHSVWMTMIRDRLRLLWKLMDKEQGSIFVHIDNEEQAYLKVLLDEVFGRKNFITQISWQRSQRTILGQGETVLNDTTEYILFYAKNKVAFKPPEKLKKLYPIEDKTFKQYNKILKLQSKPVFIEKFNDNFNNPVEIYKIPKFEIKTISLRKFEERYDEIKETYINNYENIVRFTNQQEESTFQQLLISKFDGKSLYLIRYIPSRGKSRGQQVASFYYRKDIIIYLKNYSKKNGKEILKEDDMNNFWTRQEIPMTGIAKEGRVKMRRGKKPEKLLYRILKIASKEGDYVLDSFAGSGTTGAVAHKMNRKWIMVEMGDHAQTHIIPRLKRVITGEDQSGISKDINWKGGGGFKYFELGDSLFVEDDDLKLTVLNPKMYNGPLIRAVLKVEGFRLLNPDNALHGISGRTIAHVTEQYLNQNYIDVLLREVGDAADYLIIYAKTTSSKIKLPENVEIRKIPDVLLKKFKV